MVAARLHVLAGFLALVALVPACKKKVEPPPPVKNEPTVETPVPAPDGLAAEAIIRAPDAIVQSFRTITPLIPDRAAPLLSDMLHVNRETTEQVDGAKPAYFVMVRRGDDQGFVFAVQLKDSGKVLDQLGKQGLARTEDATQALSIFEAGQAALGPRGQVLGVRRNFLLAASSVAALKELAPYATRTLPTRSVPVQDVMVTVPQAAMRGPLRDGLNRVLQAAALQRKLLVAKAKGSDAGAPKSVGALDAIGEYSARTNERIVSWLADAGEAHVAISTKDGALSIRADVEIPDPASPFGKQVAGWPVGNAVTALAAPAGALLAFTGRSGEASRVESSRDFAEALATMYPDDVTPKERQKIDEFLAAWDKARTESTTGALLYEGPARIALAARLGAKDPAALAKLTKEAFTSIFAIKGVAHGLTKEGIGVPKFSEATIAGTKVDVLSLNLPHKPGEKPKAGEPETADIVFGVVPGKNELAIVAGVGSKELFATFVETKPEKTLESFPSLKQQLEKLGPDLAGLAMGLPSRIMPLASGANVTTVAPPVDPVMLAIGKGAKGPFVALDVSRPAVELAGRFAMSTMMKP
ncbi:MAG: hypothetical protein HYV09_27955 [Deltaproteobacteria bacterium]|nr:hypothetical protein [Deltaproteobacteria bacterium]